MTSNLFSSGERGREDVACRVSGPRVTSTALAGTSSVDTRRGPKWVSGPLNHKEAEKCSYFISTFKETPSWRRRDYLHRLPASQSSVKSIKRVFCEERKSNQFPHCRMSAYSHRRLLLLLSEPPPP